MTRTKQRWRTEVSAMLLVLASTHVVAPTQAGEILDTGKKLYSQFDEELIIRDFFEDRRDGFFLDVGASFPRRSNTTYYLEQHLGWSGIGVDALEVYAASWAKLRPKSKFFVYAVTDRSGESVTFYRSAWPGVSSLSKEQVRRWASKDQVTAVRVPTITLTKLLDDNGVTSIDFLSMDIEGAEPEALAGFDIERFGPELVCIEMLPKDEHRKKILEYFETHGYERIDEYLAHDLRNWYFKPRAAAAPPGS